MAPPPAPPPPREPPQPPEAGDDDFIQNDNVQITGDYDEDRDNVREYGAVVIAVLLAVFCVIPCGFVLLGVLIPNGKIGHSVQILLGPERYVRARKVFHLDPDVDVDWMKSLDAEQSTTLSVS